MLLRHPFGAIRITYVATEPLAFRAPIHIFIRLPHIRASTGKTKCFKTHRLQGYITSKDHQVCPRDLVAIFLFDRPKQPARFVETHIIGPAVKRGKALLPGAGAAATVAYP